MHLGDLSETPGQPAVAGWSYLVLQAAVDRCLSGGRPAARLAPLGDSRSPWTWDSRVFIGVQTRHNSHLLLLHVPLCFWSWGFFWLSLHCEKHCHHISNIVVIVVMAGEIKHNLSEPSHITLWKWRWREKWEEEEEEDTDRKRRKTHLVETPKQLLTFREQKPSKLP